MTKHWTAATRRRGMPLMAAAAALAAVAALGSPALATKVAIGPPCGLGFGNGHLYIGYNGEIPDGGYQYGGNVREVSPTTGRLTTPVGSFQIAPPLGDGGPAADAGVYACGVGLDHSKNLVIADTGNYLIRVEAATAGTFYGQAMTAGNIYTVAGTGTTGFGANSEPATQSDLLKPTDVVVDRAGNLVIADSYNDRVRLVSG